MVPHSSPPVNTYSKKFQVFFFVKKERPGHSGPSSSLFRMYSDTDAQPARSARRHSSAYSALVRFTARFRRRWPASGFLPAPGRRPPQPVPVCVALSSLMCDTPSHEYTTSPPAGANMYTYGAVYVSDMLYARYLRHTARHGRVFVFSGGRSTCRKRDRQTPTPAR